MTKNYLQLKAKTPENPVTLSVAGWTSQEQTVSGITEIKADSIVIVSPAPTSFDDYCSSKIYCSEQTAGSLKFKCDTVPTNAIVVNVVIL